MLSSIKFLKFYSQAFWFFHSSSLWEIYLRPQTKTGGAGNESCRGNRLLPKYLRLINKYMII